MPRRTLLLAVVVWAASVLGVGALSWLAIGAAGRQVVAPAVPAELAPPGISPPGPDPASTIPTAPGPSTPPVRTSPTEATAGTPPSVARGRQSTSGGHVAWTCAGDVLTLTYATPVDGWRVELEPQGPAQTEVDFRRDDEELRVRIGCVDGQPTSSTEQSSDYD